MKRATALTVTVLALLLSAAASAETTLRVGVRLLPATQAAPFTSILLPSAIVNHAVYDTLTAIAPDGSVKPWLATAWRMKDQQTWEFDLRDGVVFSNGAPFTADAVVDTIEFLLSPEGAGESVGSQMRYNTVIGARALDADTVEITTTQPDAILPLHMMFLRVPEPGAWRELGAQRFSSAPVGTGPFVVTRWADGRVDLIANRASWRAPKVDRLAFITVADQAARLQALASDAVDIAIGLSPTDKPVLDDIGAKLVTHLKPEISFLATNSTGDTPLTDVRVRQALNHAVNRQQIIDVILGGATTPASQIAHDLSFGFNRTLEPYGYDPDLARNLLAAAGHADGFDFPVALVGNQNELDTVYQLIASDLAAVGVRMTIVRITGAQQLQFLYQGGWPTLGWAMTSSMYDPLGGFRIRSCIWPHAYHCDPEILPLIEAAQIAPTAAERRALTEQVMAREHAIPPGIILWQSPGFDGVSRHVRGFKASEDFIPFHEIELTP
ncbi:MAG: ABC transporter substrate-binding protein [Rhodobacteraceae bacterium]|nr:ABC transporter substrate-binding protein [Paracoccaceae bacterium]